MEWNIAVIILIIIFIANMIQGYKRGMVRSIISLVTLIITAIVLVLLGNGVKNYFQGNIFQVILAILLLSAISIVHHFLGLVFFSAKVVSKLPVVHGLDKVLGILVGFLESVLAIWLIYTLYMMFDMGMLGQLIGEYTRESAILQWFYEHNYLAYILENYGSQITLIPRLLEGKN